jgi:hypothetical protein
MASHLPAADLSICMDGVAIEHTWESYREIAGVNQPRGGGRYFQPVCTRRVAKRKEILMPSLP